jgi:D-serine deaminase-like pyridoxal phosphate-dependent protein
MRRVFGKHLIRGPDQDVRVLAKLRASFDRVSVLLDSVEPIEGPLLAQSGRLAARYEQECDLGMISNVLISFDLKTGRFTAEPLKFCRKLETLIQRVPGSSPGAPTKSFKMVPKQNPRLALWFTVLF